ncbi:hypothetical protein CDO52_00730 [Nocardiopsis gilva YIM 90087]|uniref:Phage tail protein n=1 Tax=Nocardiopsis gilva YIM 90087 TaxID=1235441 RepID=A0A223S064_9ACTN|nr:hypothetical protein [Nocardiopsis gilva]ASU81504.1 hypothetical protein CDO52_00730 [Nocardiopsis gilva YIM 90087]
MAFKHGKNTVFKIDDSGGGSLTDVSQYIDNVSGLPGEKALAEVTAFGDSGTRNIPGLFNATVEVSGHWDPTASTGPDAIFNALFEEETSTASFEYGPGGSTTGAVKYSGECWVSNYTITSAVAEKVSFSASIQVDGVVTRGTFA